MANGMAVQVTIYLNESDQWHHRPLHAEILKYLRAGKCLCGDRVPCRGRISRTPAGEDQPSCRCGGQLPVIIIFVDTDEHVGRVLPKLKEMAAHRLIVREKW